MPSIRESLADPKELQETILDIECAGVKIEPRLLAQAKTQAYSSSYLGKAELRRPS